MKPYQIRVHAEKMELDDKVEKLKAFLMSEQYQDALPIEDRSLLFAQASIMMAYAEILQKRIERFGLDEPAAPVNHEAPDV